MRAHYALVLLLFLAPALPAHAQQQASPTAQTNDALETSHAAAAREFLELMKVDRNIATMRETMLQMSLEANPQARVVEDVLRDFFSTYLNWDRVADRYVAIYADAFTEEELRALIAFYETEVGQKFIERTPRLMQQGSAIGQQVVQEHQDELERALIKAMEARQKQPPKPPKSPPAVRDSVTAPSSR